MKLSVYFLLVGSVWARMLYAERFENMPNIPTMSYFSDATRDTDKTYIITFYGANVVQNTSLAAWSGFAEQHAYAHVVYLRVEVGSSESDGWKIAHNFNVHKVGAADFRVVILKNDIVCANIVGKRVVQDIEKSLSACGGS